MINVKMQVIGMKRILITFAITMLSILSVNTYALADTGSALKNDHLRATPFADGKIVGQLTRAESVTILKKQGAWLQVKTTKTIGWVRLLSVKRGATATTNNLKSATQVATGRAGTGQVVSTTGIRGLSEEELKAASFNESEMKLLESYGQSDTRAKEFAANGGLKAVPFSNLTAPTNTGGATQ